jgi:hypothetical protein
LLFFVMQACPRRDAFYALAPTQRESTARQNVHGPRIAAIG